MTDHRRPQTHEQLDSCREGEGPGEVAFLRRRTAPPTTEERLSHAFLCWAWEAAFPDWQDAVRALARALRGLERAGLVERHTDRVSGRGPIHGITLTADGRALLALLAAAPKTGGGR